MKNSRYVLLVIGILGVAAAIYSLIKGDPFTDQIITLVISSTLIFGYWEMGKQAKKEE